MKTDGVSLNIGKVCVEGWKAQIVRLPVGRPRPQVDGNDCWLGLRLDLVWGPLVFPVAKMYHWKFWKDDPAYSQQWNNGNHWFTVKIPCFCFPFLSVMLGERRQSSWILPRGKDCGSQQQGGLAAPAGLGEKRVRPNCLGVGSLGQPCRGVAGGQVQGQENGRVESGYQK